MAADENIVPPTDDVRSGREERVSELLNDGEAREVLIRRLVEGGHIANGPAAPPPNGGAGTFLNAFPVPSGSGNGGSLWPSFPMQFPFAAPFPPFWPGPCMDRGNTADGSIPPRFREFAGQTWFLKYAGPGRGGGRRRRRSGATRRRRGAGVHRFLPDGEQRQRVTACMGRGRSLTPSLRNILAEQ